jgi:nitric oxide reductase activation protein
MLAQWPFITAVKISMETRMEKIESAGPRLLQEGLLAAPEWAYKTFVGPNEEKILSNFTKEEREIILQKKQILSSLAYFIGKDFYIPIVLGLPTEQCPSGWMQVQDKGKEFLQINAHDLLTKPMDILRFITCHEGGHKRISRLDVIPVKEWRQPGFAFLMNSIEDPRDNNFITETYPKIREGMVASYEEQLTEEKKAKEKAGAELGTVPRFMQAGFEYIKQWFRETQGLETKIPDELPEDVKEVLQNTLESAKDSWWRYPSREEADKSEDTIRQYAQVSYEILRDEIWPEFKKLLDADKEDQKSEELLKQMASDKEKSESGGEGDEGEEGEGEDGGESGEEGGEKKEGGEGAGKSGIPKELEEKLDPDEKKALEDAISKSLKGEEKEKENNGTSEQENNGTEAQKNEGTDGQERKEAREQPDESETGDENAPEKSDAVSKEKDSKGEQSKDEQNGRADNAEGEEKEEKNEKKEEKSASARGSGEGKEEEKEEAKDESGEKTASGGETKEGEKERTEEQKNSGTEEQKKEGTAEQESKRAGEQPDEGGTKDESAAGTSDADSKEKNESGGPAQKPVDLDSLPESLKQKIKEYANSLPEEKQKELEEKAEEAIKKFEKDLNEELEGKLSDNPEKKERKEKEEAERKEKEAEGKEGEDGKEKKSDGEASEKSEKSPGLSEEELKKFRERMEKTLKKDENAYEELRREVLPIIDKLEIELRDIFGKRKNTGWQSGFLTGKRINIKTRIQEKAKSISAMESRAWEKRDAPQEKDYAITLLVDLSGSMEENDKITETFKAVIVLAEVLNRLSINLEILGFNDRIYEYQKFGEPMSRGIREKMGGMLEEVSDTSDTGKARWNDDGWALVQSADRLFLQKAMNKILIVLSDGLPAESPMHPAEAYPLGEMVKKVEDETDIKLVGFGLGKGTEHVEDYYSNSMANVKVEELAEKLAELIKQLIENYASF